MKCPPQAPGLEWVAPSWWYYFGYRCADLLAEVDSWWQALKWRLLLVGNLSFLHRGLAAMWKATAKNANSHSKTSSCHPCHGRLHSLTPGTRTKPSSLMLLPAGIVSLGWEKWLTMTGSGSVCRPCTFCLDGQQVSEGIPEQLVCGLILENQIWKPVTLEWTLWDQRAR